MNIIITDTLHNVLEKIGSDTVYRKLIEALMLYSEDDSFNPNFDLSTLDGALAYGAFEGHKITAKNAKANYERSVEAGKASLLNPANGYNHKDFQKNKKSGIENLELALLEKLQTIIKKDNEKNICKFTYQEFYDYCISENKQADNFLRIYIYLAKNGINKKQEVKKNKIVEYVEHYDFDEYIDYIFEDEITTFTVQGKKCCYNKELDSLLVDNVVVSDDKKIKILSFLQGQYKYYGIDYVNDAKVDLSNETRYKYNPKLYDEYSFKEMYFDKNFKHFEYKNKNYTKANDEICENGKPIGDYIWLFLEDLCYEYFINGYDVINDVQLESR